MCIWTMLMHMFFFLFTPTWYFFFFSQVALYMYMYIVCMVYNVHVMKFCMKFYMKFLQIIFAKKKCHKYNMTWKWSDTLCKNQERISLLPFSVLQTDCKSKRNWKVELTLKMWMSTWDFTVFETNTCNLVVRNVQLFFKSFSLIQRL